LSYEDVWDIFVRDCKSMKVDQRMLDTIGMLRSQYYAVLITGNMDSFDRFTTPALELHLYFDQIVNSYNVKLHKTDDEGRIFVDCLKGRVEDALLVEDSSSSRVVFEKLGGIAYGTDRNSKTLEILEGLVRE
jgi:hypothetical protein